MRQLSVGNSGRVHHYREGPVVGPVPLQWETAKEPAKSLYGLEASSDPVCSEALCLREVEEELDVRLTPELVERVLRRARCKFEVPWFCDAQLDEGERQQETSRAAHDAA